MSRLFSIMVACTLLVALCASPSEASLTLYLDAGGGNTATVVDLDGDGVVNFNGVLGTSNWSVNVSTGISTPALGTPMFPNIDLNSVNLTATGAGSLTIMLSDNNFVAANPAIDLFRFGVGGTTVNNASVAVNAYASSSNNLFALDENIGSLGPYMNGPFSGEVRTPTTQTSGTYSLTIAATINHATGASVSSFDAQLQAVPEPASIAAWSMLAMMGVAGMVWSRRRR